MSYVFSSNLTRRASLVWLLPGQEIMRGWVILAFLNLFYPLCHNTTYYVLELTWHFRTHKCIHNNSLFCWIFVNEFICMKMSHMVHLAVKTGIWWSFDISGVLTACLTVLHRLLSVSWIELHNLLAYYWNNDWQLHEKILC